jgi:hypothetical protein
MFSGFISVISAYFGRILISDIFSFRFAFLIAVMRTVNKQKSRFGLKKRRKIHIFNYLRIWSVRIPITIIIQCGPTFIILLVIRFTDRFLFDAINKSPTNINFGLDIALTFYLLNEFISSDISVEFENIQT